MQATTAPLVEQVKKTPTFKGMFARSDFGGLPTTRTATSLPDDALNPPSSGSSSSGSGGAFDKNDALRKLRFETIINSYDPKRKLEALNITQTLDPDEVAMKNEHPDLYAMGGEDARRRYKMLKKMKRAERTVRVQASAGVVLGAHPTTFVNIGNGDIMCKQTGTYDISGQPVTVRAGDRLRTIGPNLMINWSAKKEHDRQDSESDEFGLNAAKFRMQHPHGF